MEPAVSRIDTGQFNLFFDQDFCVLRAANLDDDISSCKNRSPKFSAIGVIVDGERANFVSSLDIVEQHFTIDGKHPSLEAKVHTDGVLTGDSKSPHGDVVINLFPVTVCRWSDADIVWNRKAGCETLSISQRVFCFQGHKIERIDTDGWNDFYRILC